MWNLFAIPFHFFNSSKKSTRDQFVFCAFIHTEIIRPDKSKKRYFESSQSASEADGDLTSTILPKAGQDKWAWRGAGLGQAAGSSDTDGKLRLWLLLRWLSKGKRSLSFCLGAWIIDAWLAAWLWDCLAPVGTLTPPQAPRSAESDQGFILPGSAHPCRALPHLPLAALGGAAAPAFPECRHMEPSLHPSSPPCFWGHCCCSLVLAVHHGSQFSTAVQWSILQTCPFPAAGAVFWLKGWFQMLFSGHSRYF